MKYKSYIKKGIVIVFACLLWLFSFYGICKIFLRLIEHAKKREKRFRTYYLLENQWLKLHNSSHKLEEYFIKNKIYKIAIYGMDDIGNRVQEELLHSDNIEIAYIIDKEAYRKYGIGKIVDFEDSWDDVEAIVITDEFYYPEIKAEIQKKGNWKILSLKDIILEILQYD